MRVAVIGAGPAGMTAAMELSRGGADVDVFEASCWIGGLARTFDLWGQRVDLGPHRFFSTHPQVNRLWLDVVGGDYAMVDRLTRIYYRQRFFQYPLRPLNVLRNLGPAEALRCLGSYLGEHLRPCCAAPEDESFESWTVHRFGRRLFDLFFKSYSEKLWDLPCCELSADFAAQRIRKLSLAEAVKSAVASGYGRRHATLVDRFSYPLGGTGSVYEKMADEVRNHGGRIHLQSRVERILHEGFDACGIELQGRGPQYFDHVVSTMPLTSLVGGLKGARADVQRAAESLRFRNTVLVYLEVDSDRLFADQWLYIHDPDLKMGRVTNFRNWVPQLHGAAGTTILAVERWCNDTDPAWTAPDDQLIAQAASEVRLAGLVHEEPILAGKVVRAAKCYPVYHRGYRRHIQRLADYLRNFRGLTAIGRYGTFKYNNQDHSILMGILAAENLLSGRGHDLWSVNTDHSVYQEDELAIDACFAVGPEPPGQEAVLAGEG